MDTIPNDQSSSPVSTSAPFSLSDSSYAANSRKRFLTKARIWIGHKLFRGYGPCVCRVGPRSIVKYNSYVRFAEVAAMEFVAKHTTIPVPRVYDYFFIAKHPYLVMEFIDAPSLDRVWQSMTESQKSSIISQLNSYINQLRKLVPPHPGHIEAADGSGCFDSRQQADPFGPFPSISAFHTFLGHDYMRTSNCYAEVNRNFEVCSRRTYQTMFSHGDLAPRNILVRGGQIVGIIDWEMSGWYPEYWEYTRISLSNYDAEDFKAALYEKMDPYPEEASVEDILSSVFTRC